MELEDIRALPNDEESENVAKGYIQWVMSQEDYRCYSTINFPDTDRLISRFLRSHALSLSTFGGEVLALRPIKTFGWSDSAVNHRGFLFLNGIVYIQSARDINTKPQEARILFVDEETAEKWTYPEGYVTVSGAVQDVAERLKKEKGLGQEEEG